jgi:hypothetical protein
MFEEQLIHERHAMPLVHRAHTTDAATDHNAHRRPIHQAATSAAKTRPTVPPAPAAPILSPAPPNPGTRQCLANRSATLRSSGSFAQQWQRQQYRQRKENRHRRKSVRQKLLYAIQPALVASKSDRNHRRQASRTRAPPTMPPRAKKRQTQEHHRQPRRHFRFQPQPKKAALIQYTSGGFSNHGDAPQNGVHPDRPSARHRLSNRRITRLVRAQHAHPA